MSSERKVLFEDVVDLSRLFIVESTSRSLFPSPFLALQFNGVRCTTQRLAAAFLRLLNGAPQACAVFVLETEEEEREEEEQEEEEGEQSESTRRRKSRTGHKTGVQRREGELLTVFREVFERSQESTAERDRRDLLSLRILAQQEQSSSLRTLLQSRQKIVQREKERLRSSERLRGLSQRVTETAQHLLLLRQRHLDRTRLHMKLKVGVLVFYLLAI